MGFFSRKKKEEDFNLDDNFDFKDDPTKGLGGTDPLSNPDFSQPSSMEPQSSVPERELDLGQHQPLPQPGLQHQPMQQQQPATFHDDHSYKTAKDFEIITTKLDALRSAIESMNQRLMNIERTLQDDKKKRYW
jgi:hypothetical protein